MFISHKDFFSSEIIIGQFVANSLNVYKENAKKVVSSFGFSGNWGKDKKGHKPGFPGTSDPFYCLF